MRIRDWQAHLPVTPILPRCTVCRIPVRILPGSPSGIPVHAEPRTLENNLHNGYPDHNARI